MTSQKEGNSYKSILKGTTFLGGMQVFLILINLIRGKFVAMLLGPEGMGIANLFNTSSATVQRFASLGLNLAIVREVATSKDDLSRLQLIREIVFRLVTATALVGALFCVLFSVPLSRFSFGSDAYSWQFSILGVAVFFLIAGNGKMSILQGLHQVKALSLSSIIGACVGLVISVPLYYFYGNKAIVPAIILYSLASYISFSLFLNKSLKRAKIRFFWSEHKVLVKKLVGLGLILMAGDLIGSLCTYLLSVFVRHFGDLDTLGLYQAANSITNQYMGVIFAAMSLDYFPRLTEAADDNRKMNVIVNRQSLLVALAATPLVILLIAFAPLVIKILLSSEFMSIIPLMRIFSIGILFKAFSFAMGYIAFAKGNKKLFFILEGLYCNFQTLIFGSVGFYLWGIEGLGYAMIADFLICIAVYYVVNRIKYDYRFSRSALLHYIAGAIFATLAFLSTLPCVEMTTSIICLSVISVISIIYSIFKIKRLINTPD